ncbi:flagellar associated protein [Ectocarpus siliculosus]|uniref:Cilia- and flagella-associated protein 251 n=1 Tax=Ectocarpus siliculosus TaxID=2880 RepID=D7G5B1_ECTSI|nr:flagellar associated protein [Ectocarpus siliculosus]|eukprot:CBJ27265.1 flagellar associated protein [Ectocarpus siliculosus]
MDSSSTLNSLATNALTLNWSFGFNKDVVDGVHSLCSDGRQALFFVAAHTGVIYDYAKRTQDLLQGHCNCICAVAVSHNKKWVVTADAGQDSMLVVWDTASGIPIKSIFNPHPKGVIAMDISPDALFIVTLSAPAPAESENDSPQTISIWEWTHPEREEALFTSVIDEPDVQKVVKFNSSDIRHIVTTGDRKTMFWGWEDGGLRGYIPRMSRHDFKKGNGVYTSCCFLPGTTQAITVTSIGEIVVWDEVQTTSKGVNGAGNAGEPDGSLESAQLLLHRPKRQAVKVLKLCDGAITHVSTVAGGSPAVDDECATHAEDGPGSGDVGVDSAAGAAMYVVTAGEDGAVRFYDLKFRLEAWFEDFTAGGVTSVSFAAKLPPRAKGGADSAFRVPDFVVGTNRAYVVACAASAFEELDPERRRGSVLVQGMVGSVACVAAHPLLPRLVILCESGDVHLWDYNLKVLVTLRSFDPARLRPQNCAFHPQGTLLAIGFSSGACKILDATDLEEVASFRYSSTSLSTVRFSPDGEMDEEVQPRDTWVYVGRHRSHGRAITGLEFGTREDGRVSLVSVGEDRCLVEYNLPDSNQETGLLMAEAPRRIEQNGLPTALLWHPLLGSDYEDRLVTANNEYKFKQWNADNKSCRRTTIGPTFGGPINRLEQINNIHTDGQSRPTEFVAYGTAEKVVGLVQVPFDGNSHKMMGLIAHPGEISSLSVSGDGNYLITAGGKDLTVNVWKINTQAVQNAASANMPAKNQTQLKVEQESVRGDPSMSTIIPSAADDMAPFLEQLQGGEGGDLHEELVDYFFYALLRTQGEDTTNERSTASAVPVEEVPNIMRALGYYPTEQEVAHMSNEIKYSRFTETGEVEDSVDLNGLIRLFVNHRPVFPVSKQALTGDNSTTRMNGRQTLHPMQFAEEVLGFEDHRQSRTNINSSDRDSLDSTSLFRGGGGILK